MEFAKLSRSRGDTTCSRGVWGHVTRFVPAVMAVAFGISFTAAPVTAGGNVSLSDPTRIARLAVTVNKSETLHFGRIYTEALVANPDFADVTPLTDRALYVVGKKVGQTRLTILDKDKKVARRHRLGNQL